MSYGGLPNDASPNNTAEEIGVAFTASGLMMTVASYAITVFVLRKVGFDAAGLYQSAWTLGGNVCLGHSRIHGDRTSTSA
jgi:hypothetical protein